MTYSQWEAQNFPQAVAPVPESEIPLYGQPAQNWLKRYRQTQYEKYARGEMGTGRQPSLFGDWQQQIYPRRLPTTATVAATPVQKRTRSRWGFEY